MGQEETRPDRSLATTPARTPTVRLPAPGVDNRLVQALTVLANWGGKRPLPALPKEREERLPVLPGEAEAIGNLGLADTTGSLRVDTNLSLREPGSLIGPVSPHRRFAAQRFRRTPRGQRAEQEMSRGPAVLRRLQGRG